jgi:hypothetical protein
MTFTIKSKAILVTGRGGPYGCETSKFHQVKQDEIGRARCRHEQEKYTYEFGRNARR